MPTLEEMRAEINRLLPDFETPQFVKNIQMAYQNMPGAAIPQAALSLGSSMVGAPLGAAYGVARNLLSDKFGTQEGIQYGQQEARKVMDALRYTPPTKAGREIAETVERLPQTLTGSEMGVGMLPEIWNMPPRISPSDVQVMGARGINAAREIADIPRDFRAAQSGMTRIGAFNEPTYGAKLQSVAEDIGDVLARRQAMRSDEGGISLPKVDYLRDLIVDPNMYAIKPKGGNWVTTLGSTEPLKQQGLLGKRLSEAQYDESQIPEIFEDQLTQYDKKNNTRLARDFRVNYERDPQRGETLIDRMKSFIYDMNEYLKEQDLPLLPSLDRIEKAIPSFNQWVMGPYQKYVRNQMGTGLSTDPLLAVINEANIPLTQLFPENNVLDADRYKEIVEKRRETIRNRLQTMGADLNSPEFQNIGKVTATTPVGQQYENVLDYDVEPNSPLVYNREVYPVVNKLAPKDIIYDVMYSRPREQSGFKDIQENVLEGLISGKYNPEKISNLAPHVVVQDMIKDYQNKLKEEQRSQETIEAHRINRAKQLQTVMDYPDGSKMVVFNKASYDADPTMLIRDFGQITKDLNQCIGAGCHGTPDYRGHGPALEPHTGRPPRGATGELSHRYYYDRVSEGRGEIVSLIDPNSKYQFTIDIRYDKKPLSQAEQETVAESWVAQNKPDHLDAFLKHKADYGGGSALNAIMRSFPEIKEIIVDLNKNNMKKDISQMRGVDNGEVAPEYEEHVVQWLNENADNLNRVSDIDMLPGVMDREATKEEIVDKLSDYDEKYDIDTTLDFVDRIKEEKLLPRFFYPGDIEMLAGDMQVDLTQPPLKELSPFDQQTVLEEFDRYITNDPESLYAQDNLQDKFVNDINLLTGYPAKYNLPVDMHRKLVKMLLSDNQSRINSVISQLDNWVSVNANQLPFGLTYSQTVDAYNLLNRWYNRHPRKDEDKVWKQYPKDLEDHPNPFDEVKLKEELVRPQHIDLIDRDVSLFLQDRDPGSTYDVPQVNEDIALLKGNQDPEAKLPIRTHLELVRALLNQDDPQRSIQIKNSLRKLREGIEIPNFTKPQLDNIQNMLEQWVERYPLDD